MRVPLSWLREYVAFEMTPEALAERLTVLGMEVKGIERIGDEWQSVVVGELLEVAPHPNSPRLSLTTVRTSADGPTLSIVCGATNIEAGQRVPVALAGAVLPGGRRIDTAAKAGVESQGMLCSGAELGLTSDADGIMILPPDTPLGRPLTELYGDTVLDVDVKPNRGDALSLIGLAREVAAVTGGTVSWPETQPPETGDATSEHVSVEVRDIVRCSRFAARYLDGVSVGPSPLKIQLRLGAAGMRPISNVVDASNYVMLEMGKPTHAFDASAVADGRIIVRAAEPGERLETLDHVVRQLGPDTLVIADANGVLGIAGVIGGAASEVHDGTTAVIIESAIFDPVSIRRTGQRFALRSEASLRFEKGQEARLARIGADRVARLIAEWAGARPAVGVVDTDPVDPPPTRVAFRPPRINRLLGTSIAVPEMRDLLGRVGIQTEAVTDIQTRVWEKFIYLAPMAAFTAASRLSIGPIWEDEFIREMFLSAVDEVERVARASNIPIEPGVRNRIKAYTDGVPKTMRSSLLIDLSQGKKIEVEALQGSVVRRGAVVGVPTPIMSALYAVLKPHAHGANVPGFQSAN